MLVWQDSEVSERLSFCYVCDVKHDAQGENRKARGIYTLCLTSFVLYRRTTPRLAVTDILLRTISCCYRQMWKANSEQKCFLTLFKFMFANKLFRSPELHAKLKITQPGALGVRLRHEAAVLTTASPCCHSLRLYRFTYSWQSINIWTN